MTDSRETTDANQPLLAERPHVLLVDDDPLQRKLVAVRLRHEGFQVETAASAERRDHGRTGRFRPLSARPK